MAGKLTDRFRERRAARARARRRKRALRAYATRARRVRAAKAVLVVCVLVVFLVFALVVGDADYHATLIGWVPFFAAVLAIVLARVYVGILARSLHVSEYAAFSDCKRGTDVPFTVEFRNSSPLVFFHVEVYFYISDLFGNIASEMNTTLALGPFEEQELNFEARFEHIGTYSAGLERVVVSDFLGLFTREIGTKTKHEVNVTPQLQLLERMEFSNDAMLETTKAAKSVLADSMDYSHVREYVMGDPLKTIHWKLSARTGGSYLTKLFEVYTNPGVAIVMDFYGPSSEAIELMAMFDCVVEGALSIGSYAQQRGMETEVFFRDRYGENRRVVSFNDDEMPLLVDSMPEVSNSEDRMDDALNIVRDQITSRHGQNNIVVCSANISSGLVSLVVDAKIRRRSPLFVAVVPRQLTGRARDAYCKPLAQLDAADVPYVVVSSSEELAEALR